MAAEPYSSGSPHTAVARPILCMCCSRLQNSLNLSVVPGSEFEEDSPGVRPPLLRNFADALRPRRGGAYEALARNKPDSAAVHGCHGRV